MRHHLAALCLRFGLAFVFIYSAIVGFMDPGHWAQYLPSYILNIAPAKIWLGIFGVYELILSVFIIFKHNVTWPALAASLTLLAIVAINMENYSSAFLAVGMALSALALMFIGKIKA